MTPVTTRLAERLARLPGKRAPVKGWSLITEWLHLHAYRKAVDVVHQSTHGVRLHLDLRDYTQRVMFYDAYETQELKFMTAVLSPGDIVVDIGANTGLFSLVAGRAVGQSGEVHAFEPIPGNFERLVENVHLNDLQNVHLNASAVSDQAGKVVLAIDEDMARTSGSDSSGSFTLARLNKPVREIMAPADTIDAYVARELHDRPIRLVKVDVEGAEPFVLRGTSHTLLTHGVDILMLEVSVYALSRGGLKILDIVEPLQTAGYELYRLGLGGLLWRWSYAGEPPIPNRAPGSVGIVRSFLIGLQDLNRLFNLIAIRDDHPAVAGKPRFVRVGRLR